MIVLDTNVVSELMKSTPDTSVQNWMLAQHHDVPFSITTALATRNTSDFTALPLQIINPWST